jgi:hypothetical protein
VIVDLAVVDDRVATALIGHRLEAGATQIEDTQSLVAQKHAVIDDPDVFLIGAAMVKFVQLRAEPLHVKLDRGVSERQRA